MLSFISYPSSGQISLGHGGQHILHVLYQQAWRSKILLPACQTHEGMGLVHSSSDPNFRDLPPRYSEQQFLSRQFSQNYEWDLDAQFLLSMFIRWGLPEVYLFTTARNRKSSLFCARGDLGHHSLEERSVLCNSSSAADTKFDEHDQTRQSQSYPYSADVAETSLVPIPISPMYPTII